MSVILVRHNSMEQTVISAKGRASELIVQQMLSKSKTMSTNISRGKPLIVYKQCTQSEARIHWTMKFTERHKQQFAHNSFSSVQNNCCNSHWTTMYDAQSVHQTPGNRCVGLREVLTPYWQTHQPAGPNGRRNVAVTAEPPQWIQNQSKSHIHLPIYLWYQRNNKPMIEPDIWTILGCIMWRLVAKIWPKLSQYTIATIWASTELTNPPCCCI